MKKIIVMAEVFLLVVSVFLAVLWAAYPEKSYEPYLAVSTVILAILEFIRRKFFSFESSPSYVHVNRQSNAIEQVTSTNEPQELVVPRPSPPVSKITVREIVDAINNAPPFQKSDISNKYNGIVVKWTGFLKEAFEDFSDKRSARVNLNVEKEKVIGYSFWFVIKVDEFPEIKTLNRMSEISVLGEIKSASGDGLCVTLKPIVVEVISRA